MSLSLADIEAYPWPDWKSYGTDRIPELVRQAHAEGRAARVACTHMYEESWQVRARSMGSWADPRRGGRD